MKIARALVLMVVALSGSVAFACSCVSGFTLLPSDGATGVPTNVVLRAVGVNSVSSVTLEKGAHLVELDSTSGPGPFLRSFTPRAPLEPMRQYRLTVDDAVVIFTTGEGEDHEPPSAAQLDGVKFEGGPGFCGDSRSWVLQFTGGEDAQSPRDQLLVFAQTANSDEIADASGVMRANASVLRAGPCLGNFEAPKGTFTLALQVMDLAGNLSTLLLETGERLRLGARARGRAGGAVVPPQKAKTS